MTKLVILPSLPPNMLLHIFDKHNAVTILLRRIDLYSLRRLIQGFAIPGVVSYIRHPATNQFLRELTGVDIEERNDFYEFDFANAHVVVSLKPGRYERGMEAKDIKEEDLLILLVTVAAGNQTLFSWREEE